MTVREAIAQIKNMLKSINVDDRISNRLAYYTLLNYATILIKRDSDNRKIFNNLNKLSVYDCFDLEDIPVSECYPILLGKCNNIKRSVDLLPEPFVSSLNMPLLYVSSIDDSQSFTYSSPYMYGKIKLREFKGDEKYYWVENNRLYIPDDNLKTAKVRGVFRAEIVNKNCKPFLDTLINIPDYLIAEAFRLSVEELAKIHKRIPADENTNANSNIKT